MYDGRNTTVGTPVRYASTSASSLDRKYRLVQRGASAYRATPRPLKSTRRVPPTSDAMRATCRVPSTFTDA